MERLVEGCCAFKHTPHILHFGHVPVVERLVEKGFLKHSSHISHIGHVPLVERLVEGDCASKHTFHIRHVGHVPIRAGGLLVLVVSCVLCFARVVAAAACGVKYLYRYLTN